MSFGLSSDKSHLPDAATAVGQQLLEIGALGIPVDPDLAEHMASALVRPEIVAELGLNSLPIWTV